MSPLSTVAVVVAALLLEIEGRKHDGTFLIIKVGGGKQEIRSRRHSTTFE